MMNKLFCKKLTRGGFTLAELLIVVAILAILVAVAIPIFTSALDRAKIATLNSGVRAVRAVAVEKILGGGDGTKLSGSYAIPGGSAGWKATAKIGPDGEVSTVTVVANTDSSLITGVSQDTSHYKYAEVKTAYKTVDPSLGFEVQVKITDVS